MKRARQKNTRPKFKLHEILQIFERKYTLSQKRKSHGNTWWGNVENLAIW
jgi:hypothetical protein